MARRQGRLPRGGLRRHRKRPRPPPSPASDPGSDPARLAALESRWRDVVAASKGAGRIKIDAVLRSGSKPLSVEDGVVVIGFTHQKFVDMLKRGA